MMLLTGFADEASPVLSEALDCFEKNGLSHLELRSVEGTNVMKLTDAQLAAARDEIVRRSFKVSAIGSPIGKVKMDYSWEKHLAEFKHAVELAQFFSTRFIRLFSYYPAGEKFVENDFQEIIRRLREQAEIAAEGGLVLLMENESDIYGESGECCAELLTKVDHPNLRMAFDFANFVYSDASANVVHCWELCKPFVVYFHVKDCVGSPREIVRAGAGDGRIKEVLADALASGYEGFLSMEPHLTKGGQFGGFTGPELYTEAIDALKAILKDIGADYA